MPSTNLWTNFSPSAANIWLCRLFGPKTWSKVKSLLCGTTCTVFSCTFKMSSAAMFANRGCARSRSVNGRIRSAAWASQVSTLVEISSLFVQLAYLHRRCLAFLCHSAVIPQLRNVRLSLTKFSVAGIVFLWDVLKSRALLKSARELDETKQAQYEKTYIGATSATSHSHFRVTLKIRNWNRKHEPSKLQMQQTIWSILFEKTHNAQKAV